MVSCQGYPACRAAPLWLPDWLLDCKVREERCGVCPGRPATVELVAKRAAMAPFYPDTTTACLAGCDLDLLGVLGVEKLNSGTLSAGQRNITTGRGSAAAPRVGSRAQGRTFHWASITSLCGVHKHHAWIGFVALI